MATNTYRIPNRTQNPRPASVFEPLERMMHIDSSLSEVIHVRFLPQILFVAMLALIYIGNRHHAEKKIRTISILETTVNDRRTDYTTLRAEYMYAAKQSEVAKKAARLGLKESDTPPLKVVIKK